MTQSWTGVVLAGGRSRRMGRDKALIEYRGRTLLANALAILQPHVDELFVIGDPERHGGSDVDVIRDDVPGLGPLGGITTALRHAHHERVIVLACDMPHVNDVLIDRLKAMHEPHHDAVVPQCDGQLEPLVAIYHQRCVPVFDRCIAEGQLKMARAIEQVRARYVQICPGEEGWPLDLFRNINAPSDL